MLCFFRDTKYFAKQQQKQQKKKKKKKKKIYLEGRLELGDLLCINLIYINLFLLSLSNFHYYSLFCLLIRYCSFICFYVFIYIPARSRLKSASAGSLGWYEFALGAHAIL